MKVCIIEFEGHVECLYSFFMLFQSSKTLKIIAFISESLNNELSEVKHNFNNVEFNIKPNSQPINQFLDSNINKINNADYIIFNTLQKKPHLYQLNKFEPSTIIRIHNINTFLNRKKNTKIDWNWYSLYKDLSYFVREYLWARQIQHFKRLLHETNYIMLPGNSYQNYVIDKELYPVEKIFPSIPMAIYSSSFKKEIDEDALTICISGTIDEKRKDYLLAYAAIKATLPYINGSLKLILLGAPKGPYGAEVIKKFKSINSTKFELISFNKRISQATFEFHIKETDMFLAPVVVETRYKFFKEVYGVTKISGSITDMIRYGKPLLLSSQYQLNEEYADFIISYNNQNDLQKLIINISKNKLILTKIKHNLTSYLKKNKTQKISQKIINDFNAYKNC